MASRAKSAVSRDAGSLPEKPDRKSTRLNSSHQIISYAVFCLKKKKTKKNSSDDPAATTVVISTPAAAAFVTLCNAVLPLALLLDSLSIVSFQYPASPHPYHHT